MPLNHPIERAIVLGTSQGQDVVTVAHIPPGTRTLESNMEDKLVGRLNPPTAQGIATTTQVPISRPMAVIVNKSPFGRTYSSGSMYSIVSRQHVGHSSLGMPPWYSPRNVAPPTTASMITSLTRSSKPQT